MKRKAIKKLSVHRETLKHLDGQDLKLINGGSVLGSGCYPCNTVTCPTWIVAPTPGQGGL